MKTFLAVYMGKPGAPNQVQPDQATVASGMAAWHQWMTDHAEAVVDVGGPLGKTKRAAGGGITNIRNAMVGYVIVKALSHDAAAQMFETHPHFSIFPGDSVEIMEIKPIPAM